MTSSYGFRCPFCGWWLREVRKAQGFWECSNTNCNALIEWVPNVARQGRQGQQTLLKLECGVS